MQNKVLRKVNKKPKKDKFASKNELNTYNPLLLNSNTLTKNTSRELDGKSNLINIPLKNNCIHSDRQSQNSTIINAMRHITEISVTKNDNKKESNSNKTVNKNNLINNITEKINNDNLLINSDKIVPLFKEKIKSLDKKNKDNNHKKGNSFIKNDDNLMKINVKKNVLNLSEIDTSPANNSIEEDNINKGKKGNVIKIKDTKLKNLFELGEQKKNNSNNINKRRYSIAVINKVNRIIDNKPINNNQKDPKISNKRKETFDEIIVDDNELSDTKKLPINNLEMNNFPELSKNPFINESNCDEKFNNYSNRSKKNEKKKNRLSNHEKKSIIDQNLKSSTFATNNKTITTNPNSSNLSSATELLNNNVGNHNVNSFKKDDLSLSDNEQNCKNLLLLTKNGDIEHFSDFFEKISVLPNFSNDINYKDENGNTALHYSCDGGNTKMVEKLLNSNCNPNARNNKNEVPLHLASKKGFFEICKLLIENGASINIYDSEQNSPLHYICLNNNRKILELFLTKNPRADSKNIHGKMPIDLTTNKEMKDLIEHYLNKNKVKSYETNHIFLKKASKENNVEKAKPQKECKELDFHGIDIKRSKTFRSPSSKNVRNIIANKKNKLKDVYEDELENEHEQEKEHKQENELEPVYEIKKKNTVFIKSSETLHLRKNSSNISLSSSNHQNSSNNINVCNTNTNSKFKNNHVKSNKLEEKNEEKKNNNKSKKVSNNDNKNIQNNQNGNNNHSNNYKQRNENLSLNKLKNNSTCGNNKTDSNKSNNIILNNTKETGTKKNNGLHSGCDSNLELNSQNNYKKINNSVNVFNKKKNTNEKNIPLQNKAKNIVNNSKKKKISLPFSSENVIFINKTEENMPKIQKKAKILKSLDKNKNNLGRETTGKILNKIKYKTIKKKEKKNEKNNHIDNSLINNCNVSKISCSQNKHNFKLDSINKSNIVDQTLQDNCHQQLNLNSIEEEKISPSSFVCLALLGRGSFGEVYLVQHINSKEKYAMKVLRKERMLAQNLLKYAIAERNVLSLSNHPFIVKLNYAFQTSTKLFLLLEYCPNGDLGKHLLFEKRFSEQRAKFYVCEVLLALENLHKRGIIFRDLKPDNVVLDDKGHCKLTDFGLSKEGIFEGKYSQSFCGSIAYLAPEMLKKQGHGKAVDWYLLGVLFYEMVVGVPPFFTNKKEEIFHNIECAELKIPNYVSAEATDLLRKLLERDPNKRLGGSAKDAQEIKEHPYFKDVDWNKVYNKEIKPPTFVNYMSKVVHMYHKPRQFAQDDLFVSTDKPNPNEVMGWSFINNEDL
jgi:hypothetical protein